MKLFKPRVHKEEGSVLVVALVVLALLTILGMAASRLSETELGMAAGWKSQKQAFYAAEAAGSYAARSPGLYDQTNMVTGAPKVFSSPSGLLGKGQSFTGSVEYLGHSDVPRGSGFEAGRFRAYRYKIQCVGQGPSGAKANVEIGCYRLGY